MAPLPAAPTQYPFARANPEPNVTVGQTVYNPRDQFVTMIAFVAVTSWFPAGAVAAELNVYTPAYGEVESAPPPTQPAPRPLAKVKWSIPDSVSLDVPVAVNPPATPWRM